MTEKYKITKHDKNFISTYRKALLKSYGSRHWKPRRHSLFKEHCGFIIRTLRTFYISNTFTDFTTKHKVIVICINS